MPACSNRIAAECRKTCIVTYFCISVGQTPPAICTYLASLCSRASRLSALPEHVTKRGVPGRPARSASQTRRVVTRPDVSGVIRRFRPFPLQLTCAPAARWTSAHRRPISSDARRPVCAARLKSVLSRRPVPVDRSGAASSALISGSGQEGHEPSVEALGRDGEDALDDSGMIGMAKGGVSEQ
jgi:hypothetical protein